MREIIAEAQPFVRDEIRPTPRELFADQPFKLEIIDDASTDPMSATESGGAHLREPAYRKAAALRLPGVHRPVPGPHVPDTNEAARPLQADAGRRRLLAGRRARPMLQRIYGTAWDSKKALDAHLHRLEEAAKRDHRKLGAELDLFSFPDEIGSGLAVFHPKGGLVRRLMEDYSRQRHEEAGYEFVNSPHITKADLFETSGHLDWFADGMFPPMSTTRAARRQTTTSSR